MILLAKSGQSYHDFTLQETGVSNIHCAMRKHKGMKVAAVNVQ